MKKRYKIILCILAGLIVVAFVFIHFGGFGTGNSANIEEFKTYASDIKDIEIPQNVRIVALDEATHGNKEFQELKKDVFDVLLSNKGVKVFALEGDFGGCEYVNRYIHGGDGTAREAAANIGFAIYRTEEMEELIEYMRKYNENAPEGKDIRFYGFDMLRIDFNIKYLSEECDKLGVDTVKLSGFKDGDYESKKKLISDIKEQLLQKQDSKLAVHYTDILLQNIELSKSDNAAYNDIRDKYMAENIKWISEREKSVIFVSAHNGHVAKFGSYDSMGKLLYYKYKRNYFVIGTDFYKTTCNLPKGRNGKRVNKTFYSHDPLAKASKKAGFNISYLDFSKVPNNTEIYKTVSEYNYMGSLGEMYSVIVRAIPMAYRVFQPPETLYNAMIFVSKAHPTVIKDKPSGFANN